MKLTIRTSHLVVAFLVAGACLLYGQGSLTPPGAPAPTMKTLDQIEARTPIPGGNTTAAYVITTPGSYYLTGSLNAASAGIEIRTSNVKLDLNGFSLVGGGNSTYGIYINGAYTAITISNGSINATGTAPSFSGGRFGTAIFYSGSATDPASIRIKDITIYGCNTGILLDQAQSSLVTGCVVTYALTNAITAGTVQNCTVNNAGTAGINAFTVTGCTVNNPSGTGVAINAQAVADCLATSGAGDGIDAYTVKSSTGRSSTGIGIYGSSCVQNCYGFSSSNYGVLSDTVNDSEGYGGGGKAGIYASDVASNCNGFGGSGAVGLYSAGTASNCVGTALSAGTGLYAEKAATNCYGYSSSGTGLITSVAQNCYGTTASGTGTNTGLIFTKIGVMCWGERTNAGTSNYVLGGGLKGQVSLP